MAVYNKHSTHLLIHLGRKFAHSKNNGFGWLEQYCFGKTIYEIKEYI